MDYLIYKITNKVNNKIYIGKTKKYYKEKYFGIEGRFSNHLVCANSKSKCNDCPRLYNAIRKYGKDNFTIELLEETSKELINQREIYYINTLKSFDSKVGYNIALGGGGRSVVDVSEDVRNKISKAQSNNGEMNIKPYYNPDNEHVGYFARRRENGKVFQKYFTSKKFSLEENLNKAREWIKNISKNKIDSEIKYNRKTNLPKSIYEIKENNIIVGYRVQINIDGKIIRKSFQNNKSDLNDLLKKAIEFKEGILNAK
jgi:group I intron endonuclease